MDHFDKNKVMVPIALLVLAMMALQN